LFWLHGEPHLMEGVLKTMLLNRPATTAAIVLMALVMTAGVGFGVSVCPTRGQDQKPRVGRKAPQPFSGRIFFIREKGVGQQVSLEMVSPDGEGNTSLSKTHKPERQPRSFAV